MLHLEWSVVLCCSFWIFIIISSVYLFTFSNFIYKTYVHKQKWMDHLSFSSFSNLNYLLILLEIYLLNIVCFVSFCCCFCCFCLFLLLNYHINSLFYFFHSFEMLWFICVICLAQYVFFFYVFFFNNIHKYSSFFFFYWMKNKIDKEVTSLFKLKCLAAYFFYSVMRVWQFKLWTENFSHMLCIVQSVVCVDYVVFLSENVNGIKQ